MLKLETGRLHNQPRLFTHCEYLTDNRLANVKTGEILKDGIRAKLADSPHYYVLLNLEKGQWFDGQWDTKRMLRYVKRYFDGDIIVYGPSKWCFGYNNANTVMNQGVANDRRFNALDPQPVGTTHEFYDTSHHAGLDTDAEHAVFHQGFFRTKLKEIARQKDKYPEVKRFGIVWIGSPWREKTELCDRGVWDAILTNLQLAKEADLLDGIIHWGSGWTFLNQPDGIFPIMGAKFKCPGGTYDETGYLGDLSLNFTKLREALGMGLTNNVHFWRRPYEGEAKRRIEELAAL